MQSKTFTLKQIKQALKETKLPITYKVNGVSKPDYNARVWNNALVEFKKNLTKE